MPKPKYIRIDTQPKAKPKREPNIRCQKTGKQRTAEDRDRAANQNVSDPKKKEALK